MRKFIAGVLFCLEALGALAAASQDHGYKAIIFTVFAVICLREAWKKEAL